MRAANVSPNTIYTYGGWYAEKDDAFLSPMRKLKPPRLPRLMRRVHSWDELRAVLGTAQGKTFEDLRDNALLRLFFDTGARRHEIANLRYSLPTPMTATSTCAAA